jgi:hypothetical protein
MVLWPFCSNGTALFCSRDGLQKGVQRQYEGQDEKVMSRLTFEITICPFVFSIELSVDTKISRRIRKAATTVEIPPVPSSAVPDDEDPNEDWSMVTNTTANVSIIDMKATDDVVADNQTDNEVANQSDNIYKPPKLKQQSG